MAKRLHRMWFVPFKNQPPIAMVMPYKDAKKPVELTVTQASLMNGKRGKANECVISQCALELEKKFPHPVKFVETTTSRVFVVDRVSNGTPAHAVRYQLSEKDGKLIKAFDKKGAKFPLGATITLRVPSQVHGNYERTEHRDTGSQTPKPIQFRGVWARMRAAGKLRVPVA